MQGKVQLEARSANPVYVGVDVCKDRLDVYLHPLGEHWQVTNDPDGVRRLKRKLAGHSVALVVMEATGKYHRLTHRSLSQGGLAVAVVNPLRSRLFAQAIGTHAKTDRVDAKMLAILGDTLGPRAVPPAPAALEALQELVHARNAATADRTVLINRLAASQIAFLKAQIKQQIKTQQQQDALTAFGTHFRDYWTNLTQCGSDYLVVGCDNFKGGSPTCDPSKLAPAQPGQSGQGCPAPVFAFCQTAQSAQGATSASGQLQCTGTGPTPGAPGSFKPFVATSSGTPQGPHPPGAGTSSQSSVPAGLSGLTPGG